MLVATVEAFVHTWTHKQCVYILFGVVDDKSVVFGQSWVRLSALRSPLWWISCVKCLSDSATTTLLLIAITCHPSRDVWRPRPRRRVKVDALCITLIVHSLMNSKYLPCEPKCYQAIALLHFTQNIKIRGILGFLLDSVFVCLNTYIEDIFYQLWRFPKKMFWYLLR